jgi:hypothetical protein
MVFSLEHDIKVTSFIANSNGNCCSPGICKNITVSCDLWRTYKFTASSRFMNLTFHNSICHFQVSLFIIFESVN